MKEWLSKFAPGIRLLAVFGIGAAGVSAILPPGETPTAQPQADPQIRLAGLAAAAPQAVAQPATRTSATARSDPAAGVIPWPWLDELSQVELSVALLADLSRGETTLPRRPAVDSTEPPAASGIHPLSYGETALAQSLTATYEGVFEAVDAGAAELAETGPAAASGY